MDSLINWYRDFRPTAGQEIPVYATGAQLAKFAQPIIANQVYAYRGRKLRCVPK